MNKNTLYKLILVLIVLAAAAIGVCTSKLNWVKDLFTSNRTDITIEQANEKYDVTETFTEHFESIDIDVEVAGITIMTGDSFSVMYKANNSSIPKIAFKNSCCEITQKTKNDVNNDCVIEITVPLDFNLTKIHITDAVGSIDILGQTCDSTFASTNVGSVVALNSDLGGNVSLSSDVGSLDISNCTFDKLLLSTNTGSISVESCNVNEITAQTSIGSIEIIDTENTKFNLETELGDVYVNGIDHGNSYKN